MKRTLLILFITLSLGLMAQNDGLIIQVFDTCLMEPVFTDNHPIQLMTFDVNQDGITDMKLAVERWAAWNTGEPLPRPFLFRFGNINSDSTWCCMPIVPYDTIIDISEIQFYSHVTHIWSGYLGEEDAMGNLIYPPTYDTTIYIRNSIRYAFKDENNETHYCYGWFDASLWAARYEPNGTIHNGICVHKIVFCTIPDYPVYTGQTSIEETPNNDNIIVHPNPTKGEVTFGGIICKEALVYNVLGQIVATHSITSGPEDCVRLDLSGLKNGIYFVALTNNNGQRFVKKIIKN